MFDTISDLHKDARGFRPTSDWMIMFESQSEEMQQEIFNDLVEELEAANELQALEEAYALKEFNELLANCISYGARTREDALRWMTQDTKFYNDQCVEHWVWNQGILFTNEGRALVKELMDIVKFEEYA